MFFLVNETVLLLELLLFFSWGHYPLPWLRERNVLTCNGSNRLS